MEAAQSRKPRVLVALLMVLVSLGILVAAVYFVGGFDYVSELISGVWPVAENPVPPRPSPETTGSAEPTAAVLPADSAELKASREWMYWEQVDSQESIGELVDGEWASFTVSDVDEDSSTARLRITGEYDTGESLTGTLVLRKIADSWYFSKITADGNTSRGPAGRRGADYGVIDTVVEEQGTAENQAVIQALKDGGYTDIVVNDIEEGPGTATIEVTFSGGTKEESAGRIVCISKVLGGRKYWFVTKCEER